MVIGKGMMARAFSLYRSNNNVVVFASGVSNSRESSRKAFFRERNLLRECIATNGNKIIVYFSTWSIYDRMLKETPYVQHKIKMEKIIQRHAGTYLILRLPQVVGKTNNRTLINYFYNIRLVIKIE